MINKILIKNYIEPKDYVHFDSEHMSHLEQVKQDSVLGYLLFLQYHDVYTVGRFVQFSDDNFDIKILKSTRGGNITFHGKGQQVIYPIINIKKLGISLRQYIFILQESVSKYLASLGIESEKSINGPGIWINKRKVCFVGLAISKGVSYHGISININCLLNNFDKIDPCGDPDIKAGNVNELIHIEKEKLIKELSAALFKELEDNSYYLKKNDISLKAESFESEP